MALACTRIPQNPLFMRSEWSWLQAQVLKLPWWVLILESFFLLKINRPARLSRDDSTSEALVTSPAGNLDHIYASDITVIILFPKCPFHMAILLLPSSCQSSLTPSLAAKKALNNSAGLIIFQKTIKDLLCVFSEMCSVCCKTGVRPVFQGRLESSQRGLRLPQFSL